MRCARCDRQIPDGDRFCGRCGLARSTDGRPVDPLLGITVAGRYRIEHRIGVGGMGTVYLGTHVRISQKVAIKVLHERYAGDEQLTMRFEKEALTYGQVTHPNLVGLHDYGRTDDGTFFMVLEYCPGISLSQLLRQRHHLDLALATDLVLQLAQGLGAAHQMGIVHRDLKPENVILTETRPGRYHARLLDFGIAKRLDDEGPRLTQAGMVFGTPEYMAPEQARGKAVDGRSDLYALGCVAYELLTGDPPFTGADKLRIMHQQAGDAPPALSARLPEGVEVPAAFEAIVMRCLAKSPADRFPDTAALIQAIEAMLSEGVEPAAAAPIEAATRVAPPVAEAVAPAEPVVAAPLASNDSFGGELNVEGPPTGFAPAARRPHPPLRALGAVAAVFCGAIALTLWALTPSTPEASAASYPPTAAAPPVPEAAPVVERAEAQPPEAQAAEAKQRAEAEARKQAEAQRAEAEAKKAAEAKQRAEAEAKQRAEAEAERKRVAAERKRAEAEARRAEAKKKAEAQKRADQLAALRKALRLGNLDEAHESADALLNGAPEDGEVLALRTQIASVRTALADGKAAFEAADCLKTLNTLEPVLEVSPGARGVSHMINSCRNALPPRQL